VVDRWNVDWSSADAGGAGKRYGVFLSHKQSEAKDFARALYTLVECRDVRCFLDMEFRDDLNDLEELWRRPALCSSC
jgi:hypothetical protein